MSEESDSPFRELEQTVLDDMRKTYSDKTIDRFLRPRNLGQVATPDGFGRVVGGCGDTMEIYLKVRDDKITNASFWTDGCGPSIASGSMVTELAKGKTVLEARRISKQDVLDALDGLPEESLHCALLAADTLKEAIKDYLASRKEPWKRAYKT
jgi:nitrogen fixation NifU-like protein